MKRFTFVLLSLLLAVQGVGAQSTWRGQAEVLSAGSVPAEGFFAFSNEFPKNSILSVESYRSKKNVQVRVTGPLPTGLTCLVALSPKAASALDMAQGDSVLVGVQLADAMEKKASAPDVASNPDPDVNPLAGKPKTLAEAAPAPLVPVSPAPVTAADPATGTALAVAPDGASDGSAPAKKVFLPPKEPTSVASDAGAAALPLPPLADQEAAPAPDQVSAPAAVPAPGEAEKPVVAEAPAAPAPEAKPEVKPESEVKPAAPAPAAVPEAQPKAPDVAEKPSSGTGKVPVVPGMAPKSSYASQPSRLQGDLLGRINLTDKLEKGRSYVQVAAYADEKSLLKALEGIKSYVPLSVVYGGTGKSSYLLVAQPGANAQLGILLMHFRSQGFRQAAVVKG